MNIIATGLQVFLGLVFLGSGASKIVGAQRQVESFDLLRLPQWFRPIVGGVEIIGALGIIAGTVLHWLAVAAAIWLVGIMLGALLTHLRIRDTAQHFMPPAVLLCVAALVIALRWSSLVGHVS